MAGLSLSLLLVLAVSFLAAPDGFGQQSSGASRVIAKVGQGVDCPVGVFAERQSSSTVMLAENGRRWDRLPQALKVTLTGRGGSPIEAVEVILHGVPAAARVLPAATAIAPPDISKAFEFRRKTGDKSLSNFEVWMDGVGTLRWVDIAMITYADGASWHSSKSSNCRAVPSSFMLVGTR